MRRLQGRGHQVEWSHRDRAVVPLASRDIHLVENPFHGLAPGGIDCVRRDCTRFGCHGATGKCGARPNFRDGSNQLARGARYAKHALPAYGRAAAARPQQRDGCTEGCQPRRGAGVRRVDDVLQRSLSNAIRAEDAERIVIIESNACANFADPYWNSAIWWARYPTSTSADTPEVQMQQWDINQGIIAHPEIPSPVFIGEMKAPDATLDSANAL